MRDLERKQAQRTVQLAVSLLDPVLEMNADTVDLEHAQRLVRCACLLLSAHADAFLNDKEQDDE